MNLRTIRTFTVLSLGAALALGLSACGVGDDAHVGDSNGPQTGTGGSGTGGAATNGGSATSGGAAGAGTAGNSGSAGSGTAGATGGGIACGKNTCKTGEYCCNPTCGMCAPMGAACIQVACDPNPTCTADSDCTLHSDYCNGCDCRALAPGEPAPTCSGAAVQCFADPCLNATAACVNGACTVVKPLPPQTECQADSDCRLADDYCTGCDCVALAPGESLPTCSGPGVQCLVQPCMNKTAACVNGACVAQ